jgi:hypothetical protein
MFLAGFLLLSHRTPAFPGSGAEQAGRNLDEAAPAAGSTVETGAQAGHLSRKKPTRIPWAISVNQGVKNGHSGRALSRVFSLLDRRDNYRVAVGLD